MHDTVPALPLWTVDDADSLIALGGAVVDVRKVTDFAAGHVPGVLDVESGALTDTKLPEGPEATMCGKTERVTTAASVLERRGYCDVAVLRCGYTAWTAHHQTPANR